MPMRMVMHMMALQTANIHMMRSLVMQLPPRTTQARHPGKPGIPMRRERRRIKISGAWVVQVLTANGQQSKRSLEMPGKVTNGEHDENAAKRSFREG